jgi:hypothetical protein
VKRSIKFLTVLFFAFVAIIYSIPSSASGVEIYEEYPYSKMNNLCLSVMKKQKFNVEDIAKITDFETLEPITIFSRAWETADFIFAMEYDDKDWTNPYLVYFRPLNSSTTVNGIKIGDSFNVLKTQFPNVYPKLPKY